MRLVASLLSLLLVAQANADGIKFGPQMKVGQQGPLLTDARDRFRVLSVWSPTEMIGVALLERDVKAVKNGRVVDTVELTRTAPFVVRGVDTSALADGAETKLSGAFKVTGTTKDGKGRTYFVVEPVKP